MPQVGQGILKGMGVTIKHLFGQKITRQYPEYKRDLPPRSRGMLTVDIDRCVACLQCMRVCPDHCISIQPTKRDADGSGKPKPFPVGFVIDDSRCMYCALCVEVCPVNCIYHTEEFEAQAYNRLELARQFGERPVDPTVDPKPAVKVPYSTGGKPPIKERKKPTGKQAPATASRPMFSEAPGK